MDTNLYIKKINNYNDLIKHNYKSLYQYKITKYLIKYGGGTNKLDASCQIPNCLQHYDETRNPSNCDRILYNGPNISVMDYGVYGGERMKNHMIRLSDHLLVYGKFTYNNKPSIIFTWNIAKLHDELDLRCGIGKLLGDFLILSSDNEFIIFCLQESNSNDLFPRVLLGFLKKFLPGYKVSFGMSESRKENFNVRLIVFHKTIGIDMDNISDYNTLLLPSLNPTIINLESRQEKALGQTKTAIGLTIDGLTLVSCHFPLDTDDKTSDNYLGNHLRIAALDKIKAAFKESKNIIIAGDLNYRNINNQDQLTTLLTNQTDTFKLQEFSPMLTERTCKLHKC